LSIHGGDEFLHCGEEGGDGYFLFAQIKESEVTIVATMDAFLQFAWDKAFCEWIRLFDDYSTISSIPPDIRE
jgi:hypothetical protein